MIEREVQVRNYPGIHAHPAGLLVRQAGGYQAEISITKGDLTVNGKSIMGVLMLAAEFGSTLTIRADGVDEEEAVTGLIELIESRFGAEGAEGRAGERSRPGVATNRGRATQQPVG